ncbi:ParA family protein [Methylobacterium sp. AMS5]|uniref:ParA family protein n=1 Tax=Methylobacterium sp. AMS5 TaxID=925818 RepID=UPI00074F9495|nr:ParA family protein [Methylobacterium sp. AMS5]AMB48293.1 partition protein parA [Methylobacterium sp. AMS5]
MLTIACLSQKGGVGKSTLTRLIARSYAAAGWRVKIADLNTKQKTSVDWASLRMEANLEPSVSAEPFANVRQALLQSMNYDLMVFDGRPDSETAGRDVAKEADLIIVPTSVALDDLAPQVKFAHELISNGIERKRILFVINQTGESQVEVNDAREYVRVAGYGVCETHISAKPSYRTAQNTGRALNETTFPSLNERADALMQEVVDKVAELDPRASQRASLIAKVPA